MLSESKKQPQLIRRITQALSTARAQLDKIKQKAREPIAIIGIGCRLPGSDHPEAFWELLYNGVDAITDIPAERWDMSQYYDPDPTIPGKIYTRAGGFIAQPVGHFDPQFFGISPREAASMDPQHRLLLEVAWEALEHAGQAAQALRLSKTGVFAGICTNDYEQLHKEYTFKELGHHFASGTHHSFAVGRISYLLGLQGPNVQLDTACSSSLVAIHLACQSLRAQESDLALAGGVNLILAPESTLGRCSIKSLAPDGRCKTFDASADGYGQAEGCGMVVLKRLSDAIADGDHILAVIRGSAMNHDGPSSSLTVPNEAAQERVIQDALQNAQVKPEEVGYIEAHGTGTVIGDPIEINALHAVFGQRRDNLIVGSVKSNMGHLEAAAGVAGVIKLVLSLQAKLIPPHLHLKTPNPHIAWDAMPIEVPQTVMAWPTEKRIAGISSFGMSGTNAHIIMAEGPVTEQPVNDVERPLHLFTLSAKSDEALRAYVQRYAELLASDAAPELANLCYTSNVGRNDFSHRLSIATASLTRLEQQLAAYIDHRIDNREVVGLSQGTVSAGQAVPKIAFLFTGQGAQYVNMGRELYETQPSFRATLNHCDQLLQKHLGESLLEILYPASENHDQHRPLSLSKINQTTYTQPALFALEYALATLWQSWGIQPDVLIGHSVGELVAACVAGVFTLESGLKLVAARGRLMGALPQEGEMVSLLAADSAGSAGLAGTLARVRKAIAPYRHEVSIAAVNGPQNIVISGKREAVLDVAQQLAIEGIKTRRLTVSHAFHSPLMVPMLREFRQVARSITYHKPTRRLISNVTGQLAGQEMSTPEYWVRHVRDTVRFADGMATLQEQKVDILLEVGPKPILLGLVKQNAANGEGRDLMPSLRKGRSDWQQMLHTLGQLYVRGVKIDWAGFDKPYHRHKVVLPTYPFQRQHYWIDVAKKPPIKTRVSSESHHPLLGTALNPIAHLPEHRIWQSEIERQQILDLTGHKLWGRSVLPASAYMDMLLTAAKETFAEKFHALKDLELHQAFFIPQEGSITMQTILSARQNGLASIEMYSRPDLDLNKSSEWTLHASAKIVVSD